jgi:tryptophan-rich sensory protein
MLFTKPNTEWYKCITPPSSPTKIAFPIVWTILYILIAFALARSIIAKRKIILILFAINLILNILWCYIFFILRNPFVSLIVMLLILTTAIIIIILLYRLKDNISCYYLIPYILWLIFAMLLNFQAYKKTKICKDIFF